ncbi:uncharacterized protein LODBEIA_P29590 [Lodderomyces beijingensis]|uniref:N-(5'-phosphoribosyl)anthranilate isomerase n=1 Tax=Lodderomyces beijingensis TaxID=1775926 RepID=A0ABP0ZNF3_9ASCO
MKLVKICGLQTTKAAETAILNGADFVGCILVPNRTRTIANDVAIQISNLAHHRRPKSISQIINDINSHNFTTAESYFEYIKSEIVENGPFIVGVFRNQSMSHVLQSAKELQLDFIQLHGDEDKMEWIEKFTDAGFGVVPRYVIPRDVEQLKSDTAKMMEMGALCLPLVDSDQGGEGKLIDWDYVSDNLGFTRVLLAGGLNPDNISDTKRVNNVIGYDVSGGVETDGEKDLVKITRFIVKGKAL